MSNGQTGYELTELEGARSPGWYDGECFWCRKQNYREEGVWITTGLESVVVEAWHEHAKREHPRRLAKMYEERASWMNSM